MRNISIQRSLLVLFAIACSTTVSYAKLIHVKDTSQNFSIAKGEFNIRYCFNDTTTKKTPLFISVPVTCTHPYDTSIVLVDSMYKMSDTKNKAPIYVYDTTIKTISCISFTFTPGNLPDTPEIFNSIVPVKWKKVNDNLYVDTVNVILLAKNIPIDDFQGHDSSTAKLYVANYLDTNAIAVKCYNSKIAKSKLQVFAAAYTTPGTITADDPKLTQTYIRLNIPLKETRGINYDATPAERVIWFRNFLLQGTYTTNAGNANYLDSLGGVSNKLQAQPQYAGSGLDSLHRSHHINRLDLLENANFNFNITLPVLTYVLPYLSHHRGDLAHVYVEPFCSFLSTTLSKPGDSVKTSVYSLQSGFDVCLRTEHTKILNVPFYVELTAKIFWITPLSNSVAPDLNYQYNKVSDFNNTTNGKHILDPSNHPYFNFDALFIYYTNNSNIDGSSNVFAHASFFTNAVRTTSSATGHVFNNYMQIQVGYGLNLQTFFKQIQAKAPKDSDS